MFSKKILEFLFTRQTVLVEYFIGPVAWTGALFSFFTYMFRIYFISLSQKIGFCVFCATTWKYGPLDYLVELLVGSCSDYSDNTEAS